MAALPFFGATLAGDLVFMAVIFSAYALVARNLSRPETTPAW